MNVIVFERPPGVIDCDSLVSGGNNMGGEGGGSQYRFLFEKSLLQFSEGVRDHVKQKDLVSKSMWIPNKLSARLANALKKRQRRESPYELIIG